MASSGMNCMRHQSHEANGTPSVDQVNTPLHLQAIIMRKKQNQKTLLPYSRCLVQSHHQVRATHMELKLDACKQGGNREMCLCIRASNEQVRSQQGQKGHDAKPKRKRKMQIAFRSHYGGAAIFPVSVGDWGMQRYCTIPSHLLSSPLRYS